jgi:hypothetical protein
MKVRIYLFAIMLFLVIVHLYSFKKVKVLNISSVVTENIEAAGDRFRNDFLESIMEFSKDDTDSIYIPSWLEN